MGTPSSPLSPLARESGCIGQLNWRTDLPPEVSLDSLAAVLGLAGWSVAARHRILWVLRRTDGCEISIVPKTRRVRLRVHYLIDQERRSDTARSLYRELSVAWEWAQREG
ncbi:MAG: hypothetical protein AAF604_09755 [Acidobacteriota bacterium]